MALAAGPEKQIGKLVIRNIGLMLSGALENPLLDADTIVAEGGRITAVGRAKDCDTDGATVTIDAQGCALSPGLIDSHVHPVFGDWTPRQSQFGWIDSFLHGGVTTMVSAGEVHLPGPAARHRRPQGARHHRAARLRQFPSRRREGAGRRAGDRAGHGRERLRRTRRRRRHAAGRGRPGHRQGRPRKRSAWSPGRANTASRAPSTPAARRVPGSGYIDADTVLEADADIIGHINGGHTALPLSQIRCLCEGCGRGIEIVHNGNELAGLSALRFARELDQLDRVILGTDSPAGSGVQPLGILRMIALLSSLGDLPAEQAFCLATGNTARMRKLDCGLIEAGRAADFVLLDRAQHSSGTDLLDQCRRATCRASAWWSSTASCAASAAATRRRPTGCRCWFRASTDLPVRTLFAGQHLAADFAARVRRRVDVGVPHAAAEGRPPARPSGSRCL